MESRRDRASAQISKLSGPQSKLSRTCCRGCFCLPLLSKAQWHCGFLPLFELGKNTLALSRPLFDDLVRPVIVPTQRSNLFYPSSINRPTATGSCCSWERSSAKCQLHSKIPQPTLRPLLPPQSQQQAGPAQNATAISPRFQATRNTSRGVKHAAPVPSGQPG